MKCLLYYDILLVEGTPLGMRYRLHTQASGSWTTYWFEKNLQGDIVAVYNSAGTKILSYKYDAWGNFTGTTHATDSIGGAIGAVVTYVAPSVGSFISNILNSYSYAFAGGGASSIAVSGALLTTTIIGVVSFAKDRYVEHLKKGMTQNQKEHFQREIEDLKGSEGRGGNDNLSKDVLEEIANFIKELFK